MNADEYISRNEALDCFACDLRKPDRLISYQGFMTEAAFRISDIPASDVRPVVLCRDCIHFQQFRPHDGFCKIDGMLWNNDFFCANGKREES